MTIVANAVRLVPLFLCLVLTACVSTGAVQASQPLTAPLTNKAVAFELGSASAKLKEHEEPLKAALEESFREAGLFDKVGEPGDLTIKVTITGLDKLTQRAVAAAVEQLVDTIKTAGQG
jgi:hypothetical protein